MACVGVIIVKELVNLKDYTDAEVREHAAWLGMNPDIDTDLLYLAREALHTPLTDGWKPCRDADGNLFFFNFETGQSSWDHPADATYRNLIQDKIREKRDGGRGRAQPLLECQRDTADATTAEAPVVLQPRRHCCWWRLCCRRRAPQPAGSP